MDEKAMRPKKVAHIITRLDPGGSTINTLQTVAGLAERGYDVWLVSGRTRDEVGAMREFLRRCPRPVIFIPELVREVCPWRDMKAFWRLYRLMKREKFDIVHTHSSKAGILGRWAAWLAGVPWRVHTPHGHIFYGYFGPWTTRVFLWLEKITTPVTHRVITLTDQGRKEHMDLGIAPPEKLVTIRSGVDIEACLKECSAPPIRRQALGLDEEAFIFGTVARLDPVKGVPHIVEALARIRSECPHARVLLVGEGSQREALERQVHEAGLEGRVVFAGYQRRVIPWMRMMDVFILASLNEGMGRVLVEAMVCARPVIASKTGGIPELVRDGRNGLLVEPGSVDQLADAMRRLYSRRDEARAMGKAGRRGVTERFSLKTMIEEIDCLYKNRDSDYFFKV